MDINAMKSKTQQSALKKIHWGPPHEITLTGFAPTACGKNVTGWQVYPIHLQYVTCPNCRALPEFKKALLKEMLQNE
jgi:hypothetical protein